MSFRKSILFILMMLAFGQVTAQSKILLVPYHAENRWGFSDTLANIVIKPADYDSVHFFNFSSVAHVYKKGKVNVIDSTGTVLLKDYCDEIVTIWNEPYVLELKNKNLVGLYDIKKRRYVLDIAYDAVNTWYEKAMFATRKKKAALFSYEGKQLTDFRFDSVAVVLENSVAAYSKGKIYNVSFDDGKITPLSEIPEYDGMYAMVGEGWNEEKPQPATKELEERITNDFDLDSLDRTPIEFESGNREVYRVYKNGKTGLYFLDDRLMMKPKYDALSELTIVSNVNLYMVAVLDGQYGVIDKHENKIIPFEYDNIASLNNSFAYTSKQDKKGVWIFNTVYPPIKNLYDQVALATRLSVSSRWSFLLFKVWKNGKWGYVGENGVEYFK